MARLKPVLIGSPNPIRTESQSAVAMAHSLLLEELGGVPSAARLTHPKAAAHPSHKVWPVLPASRCSASCTPAISAGCFLHCGPSGCLPPVWVVQHWHCARSLRACEARILARNRSNRMVGVGAVT